MNIRRSRDGGEILEIEQACFAESWTLSMIESSLQIPFYSFYIGEIHRENAGYIGFSAAGGEGELLRVGVLPKYRGQKLGEALVKHMLSDFQTQGVERVFLEVRRSNVPAIALYEKLGFSVLGVRRAYYENPKEDALVMERSKKAP